MGKERLNSEQIKEICKIQHKLLIAKILISKMPMAYTNNNVYQLEKDMKIRDIVDNCENEMKELLLKYGSEIIVNTFSDKEYLQRPENRFTFDNQKQATKEVTGEELTLEEFMERVDK